MESPCLVSIRRFDEHLPVFRDNPHMDKFAAMHVFVKIADAENLSAAGRQLRLSLTSVKRFRKLDLLGAKSESGALNQI